MSRRRMKEAGTLLLVLGFLVAPGTSRAQLVFVNDILIEGQGWKSVADDFQNIVGLAADSSGHLYVSDSSQNKIFRIDPAGNRTVFVAESHGARGIAAGTDGRIYACQGATGDVVAYNAAGQATTIAKGIHGDEIVVTPSGGLYVSQAPDRKLWHVTREGARRVVFRGLRQANGLALWSDGSTLVLADGSIAYLWTFRAGTDGSLSAREPYSTLRTTLDGGGHQPSGAAGMTVDTANHLFVTSAEGLQFFDKEGRLSGVILAPRGTTLTSVVFGGPARKILYVSSRTTIFRRQTKGAKVEG